MKIPTKKYSNEKYLLLSGKIKESSYIREVQEILAKKGIFKRDNYITVVITPNKGTNIFRTYNEDVWDAVEEVLHNREIARKVNDKLLDRLLTQTGKAVAECT
ncbi:hypothetical protein GCM10028808_73530 [Spirosoma migulaei]